MQIPLQYFQSTLLNASSAGGSSSSSQSGVRARSVLGALTARSEGTAHRSMVSRGLGTSGVSSGVPGVSGVGSQVYVNAGLMEDLDLESFLWS